MYWCLSDLPALLAASELPGWLNSVVVGLKVVIGFSLIIFVHELGHFLAAKWVGIRVDRFAIGFGYRLFGWRKGEGFTFGSRPNYSGEELEQRGWGETDYCCKALPLGGYVKMLGQDDVQINDDTGEVKLSDDPRAFTNKPVRQRMIVVSAGVIFNMLFAIVAFMCVYMVGRNVVAPRVTVLDGASPAARAGVVSGDEIVEVNGRHVNTFHELLVSIILSDDGVARLKVRRNGELLPDELVMQFDDTEDLTSGAAGLTPALTTVIVERPKELAGISEVEAGDRITYVGGIPVSSGYDVYEASNRLASESGETRIDLTIERPDPEDPGSYTTETVHTQAVFSLDPTIVGATREVREDSAHILGLLPRQSAGVVKDGDPGDKAGFEVGDVILQWGTVLNPRYSEIVENIWANSGKPVPVAVLRDGKIVELTVTPRKPFSLLGTAKARVGIGFDEEGRLPVVADVVEGTPAAALHIPRGALLLAIDGQPVESWFEVIRRLMASAGRAVTVKYRSGAVESEVNMEVPSSIVNELELPPLARVTSINGKTRATLETGETVRLPGWLAVRTLLEQHRGEVVQVQYQRSLDDLKLAESTFQVRSDLSNSDPWQMRIHYGNADLLFKPLEKLQKADNPLDAAVLGVKAAGNVLGEVRRVLGSIVQNLVRRRAGTARHVSGPVGIISMAADRAKAGYAELFYFLAFLSVNLAVLNFIPLPVLDGGLMVFLIIEKLKGKPLSVKTQMVATLIGLATIVLLMLLVTFQDITKMFN